MNQHLLSLLLFTPLSGSLVLLLVPGRQKRTIRVVTSLFFLTTAVLAALTALRFGGGENSGYQLIERAVWIPSLGAQYLLGVDGISLLLVVLTAVLGGLAALFSGSSVRYREREFYAVLLLQVAGLLGVFLSLDLFLFFLFWQISLVPMYFLIGIWGDGERRGSAALKFLLYMSGASMLLLLGTIILFLQSRAQLGHGTFELGELLKLRLPLPVQLLLFILLSAGFAARASVFPLHSWLPDGLVQAPTAGSVVLAGVLLPAGTYGLVRFALPLAPQAATHPAVARTMMGLSVLAILYGALASVVQLDWKRVAAYSSISQMGFCTLGLFAANQKGIGGSVLQQVNHGISAAMLFLLVGILYGRRHTQQIAEFAGLRHAMPRFAMLLALAMLSTLGFPLLNGFIGKSETLQGVFQRSWAWAAWTVPGIVLMVAYWLWLYQRTMLGKLTSPLNMPLNDLTAREWLVLMPLAAAVVAIGAYPTPLLTLLHGPVEALARLLA